MRFKKGSIDLFIFFFTISLYITRSLVEKYNYTGFQDVKMIAGICTLIICMMGAYAFINEVSIAGVIVFMAVTSLNFAIICGAIESLSNTKIKDSCIISMMLIIVSSSFELSIAQIMFNED